MNKLNKRASALAAGVGPARPRWPLLVMLLLFLCSCAAALVQVYPAIQERLENARLKEELRHQQLRTQRLRGLVDTLATGKRPAPTYNL